MLKAAQHPRLLRFAAATFLYGLAIAACFHAVIAHPGSRVPNMFGGGWPDGVSTLRDYWAASFQHRNPFDWTHDALSGAPEGVTRVPAAVLANGGIQTAFVWGLRGPLGLVGAWNAFTLLGLLATALATYVLLERLGCSFAPSLLGGAVFALGPDAFERAVAGQPGLLQSWVFPLLTLALLRLHERGSAARAATAGLLVAVAFYLSAWQGLFASFLLLVFLLVELATLRAGRAALHTVALGALAYLVAALALIPIFVLYERDKGGIAATADFYTHAATLSAYLLPSPRNPLFHWLAGAHPPDLQEETLYVGLSTLALALAAVVLLVRRDRWLTGSERRHRAAVFAAILAPAAFLSSLSPWHKLGPLSVPTPAAAIDAVSGYWHLDTRFGLLVGFAAVILAALALSALARRPGRGFALLTPLAFLLALLELLPGSVGTYDLATAPPWVRWLEKQPPGIVATYPWQSGTGLLDDVWYQSFDHHPRFVDLHNESARDDGVRLLARDLWRPLTAQVLATEGVRYVVAQGAAATVAGPAASRYRLLARFGGVRIYAVSAPKLSLARALRANAVTLGELQGLTPPPLAYGDGFNKPEPFDGASGRWMVQDGSVTLENSEPGLDVTVSWLAFSNGRPRLLELLDGSGRVLGRRVVATEAATVSFGPFAVPVGTTALRLVALPGPALLGPSDPRQASVFLGPLTVTPIPAYTQTGG